MQRVILHHYPKSPFAEKIRLILGAKHLHWASVLIPSIMPKPDVVALTGGYRKTPILQIGADIYCDSALIADVLDAMSPEVPLYPAGVAAASRIVAQWADSTLFWTAIPYTLQPAGLAHMFSGDPPEAVKAFGEDRKSFRANIPRMRGPEARGALTLYLTRLEEMIGDQAYFFGAQPSIADFSIYHCLWFVARGGPMAQILEPFRRVQAWRDRMQGFGHGAFDRLDSGGALAIARASTLRPPREWMVRFTASPRARRSSSRPRTRASSPSKENSTPQPPTAFPSCARTRAPGVWSCTFRAWASSFAAETKPIDEVEHERNRSIRKTERAPENRRPAGAVERRLKRRRVGSGDRGASRAARGCDGGGHRSGRGRGRCGAARLAQSEPPSPGGAAARGVPACDGGSAVGGGDAHPRNGQALQGIVR